MDMIAYMVMQAKKLIAERLAQARMGQMHTGVPKVQTIKHDKPKGKKR